MIKKILVFSLLLFNISVYSQIFKDQYIKQATKTGEIWMQNITSEKYDLAYTLYSEKVKENSDSIHWSAAISQLMNEFGKFKNREIIESRFESNIENLGDGFYVVIEYKSKSGFLSNELITFLKKKCVEPGRGIITFS